MVGILMVCIYPILALGLNLQPANVQIQSNHAELQRQLPVILTAQPSELQPAIQVR
jgi:tryptophanyl-tRNA synthetase